PLIGFPLAWSAGTDGPVTAEAVLTPFNLERHSEPEKLAAEIEKYQSTYKGQLKGKLVLLGKPRTLGLQAKPSSARLSEADLNGIFLAPEPRVPRHFDYSKMEIPEDADERNEFFAQAPPQFE